MLKSALMVIMAGTIVGQAAAQQPLVSTDSASENNRMTVSPEALVVIPESAKIRYKIGEAPFYVNLESFARELKLLLASSNQRGIDRHTSLLGMTPGELEKLSLLLSTYRERDVEQYTAAILEACTPYLREGSASLEFVRAELGRIDDDDARKRALAAEVMQRVEAEYGSELAQEITAAINHHGSAIEYSKTDIVKAVENAEGMDLVSYFTSQCDAL